MDEHHIRPATRDDLGTIIAIKQAEDIAHRGHSDVTAEDFSERILAASSFDAARDWVVADGDAGPFAAAIVFQRGSNVTILPEREDPQLRSGLLVWTERRQLERGDAVLRTSTNADHLPAVTTLRRRGYELERVHALMSRRFSETGPPEAPRVAPGYRLRAIDAGADSHSLHLLNERAFAERPDHMVQSAEEFDRSHLGLDQYEPAWSRLAETEAGEPSALLIGWRPPDHPHGYVATLGVDPDHRGRGLGRALLLSAFATIADAGLATAELHVAASDNQTALGLYRSVEMSEQERFEHYARLP